MSVSGQREQVNVDPKQSEMYGLAKPQEPAKAVHEFVVMSHAQRFTPTVSGSTPGAGKYKIGVPKHPLVVVCSCQWECHADTQEQAEAIGREHLRRHNAA